MSVKYFSINVILFVSIFNFSCSDNSNLRDDEEIFPIENGDTSTNKVVKILSLGDSYTIGHSVCDNCRFPEQLKDSIKKITGNNNVELTVIAETGWTSKKLLTVVDNDKELKNDFNITTLLIGVNNQFQNIPFEEFERDFLQLVNKASKHAKSAKQNVIVISIPDYAFTPFGGGNPSISKGIDKYNAHIENYCKTNGITYIFITDITRKGLENPSLVAIDGLHPSTLAYTQFVSKILPYALQKIN